MFYSAQTSGNARRTSTAAATTPTGPDERDVDEGSLVSASENHVSELFLNPNLNDDMY